MICWLDGMEIGGLWLVKWEAETLLFDGLGCVGGGGSKISYLSYCIDLSLETRSGMLISYLGAT